MAEKTLALTVEPLDGERLVRLQGEVDMVSAPRLARCLEELAEEGARHVVLDLAGLTFIDSTGLRAFVRGLNALRANGGDMAVQAASPSTRKLLRISSLERVLEVRD